MKLFSRNMRNTLVLIGAAIALLFFEGACSKNDVDNKIESPTPIENATPVTANKPQKVDLAEQPKEPSVKKCPKGMVRVPGGKVSVVFRGERWGGDFSQDAIIRSFCIDKYEASKPDATKEHPGKDKDLNLVGVQLDIPPAQSKKGVLPWASASYEWAKRSCYMAGKRLPTLAEWQMAYSGPDPHPWPWGDQWEPNTCWADNLPMKLYPTGACCYKICREDDCFTICDMVGGLSEWILDNWDTKCYGDDQVMIAGGPAHIPNNMPASQSPDPEKPGCWKFTSYSGDRAALHHHNRNSNSFDDGFRCAVSLEEK